MDSSKSLASSPTLGLQVFDTAAEHFEKKLSKSTQQSSCSLYFSCMLEGMHLKIPLTMGCLLR